MMWSEGVAKYSKVVKYAEKRYPVGGDYPEKFIAIADAAFGRLYETKYQSAEDLWQQLSDVPVNDDGEIEQPFLHFEVLTDREEIWLWFEETFDVSVHDDLMFNCGGTQ